MTDTVAAILREFGPWAALSVALLWWIHKRMEKQDRSNEATEKRLQTSVDWTRNTLVEMNTRMVDAMADVAHALREAARTNRETAHAVREMHAAFRARPCMRDLPPAPAQPATEPLMRKGPDPA